MYAPFDLSGRTALVTGGNGGIGLGMARALLQAGARVAIWGSNPDKTEQAREALAAEGSDVYAFTCDISNEQAVQQCFDETLGQLGRVDACFANAGVSSRPTRVTDMSAEDFDRVIRINLNGAFYTARSVARHMRERDGGGSIVFTASTAAVEGAARNSHYGASKGALTSYARALAVELARDGVRVNSILPGWIRTDMTDRAMNDEKFTANVMPRIPVRRWGEIEDFGGIAVYLASDASAYHTGDQFIIDGGYTKF